MGLSIRLTCYRRSSSGDFSENPIYPDAVHANIQSIGDTFGNRRARQHNQKAT